MPKMEEITMKNLNLKNLAVLVLVFALLLMTTACGAGQTITATTPRSSC